MTRLSIKISIIFILGLTLLSLFNFIMTPSNSFGGYYKQSIFINYSDGFIRRGLLGEFIKYLHIASGINVLAFTKYFTLGCYLIFCGYMIYLFRKNKISVFFLLMPYVLPFYALIDFIIIRDFFLLLLFTISIILIRKISNIFIIAHSILSKSVYHLF